MSQRDIAKAKDQDLFLSVQAMKRAALLARQVAVQTGTAIVIRQGNKIVRRTAAELVAESVDAATEMGANEG